MSENGNKPRELKIQDGRTLTVNLNWCSMPQVMEYLNTVVPPYEVKPEGTKPEGIDGKALKDYEENLAKAQKAHEERVTKREAVLAQVAEFRGKCCGLTAEAVMGLGYEDYALLGKKITDLIIDPVGADPN